jgi:hypothetical protein
MPTAALTAGAALLGPELSKLLGGSTPTTTPSTPSDLQGMRGQQIGLLNYLIGMGPDPRLAPGGQQAGSPGQGRSRPAAGQSGQSGATNPGMSIYQPQNTPQQMFGTQGSGIGGTTPLTFPTGQSYAHGGLVHGPGTATSDSVPAQLSNGEGVLTAAAVQHLGGPALIALLNHLGARGALPHQIAAQQQMAPHGLPAGATMPMGLQQIMKSPHLAGGGTVNPDGTVTPSATGYQMYQGQPVNQSTPNGVEPGQVGAGMGQTPFTGQPYTGQPANSWGTPDTNSWIAGPNPNNGTPASPLFGAGNTGNTAGASMTPQQRLESFFGPMGVTPSGLQQQGTNAYSQYLNQPSPWDRAAQVTNPQLQQNLTGNSSTQNSINGLMGLQTGPGQNVSTGLGNIAQNPGGSGGFTGSGAMNNVLGQLGQGTTGAQQNLSQLGQGPATGNSQLQQALQGIGTTGGANQYAGYGQVGGGASMDPTAAAALGQMAQNNPGQGVVNSLQPLFQQNLAAADQTGGRFGTSNALGRQNATNQFNQTAAQALQTGATQQQQAASSLGQLSNQAQATGMQGAIASAGNQLQGAMGGGNQQLQALGLAQQGNLGLGQLGLGANSTLGNQQLSATGQSIGAQQGLNANTLQALSQLGGFNTQAAGQQGTNTMNAGNLGVQQGNISNNAAGIYGGLANNQGTGNLNTTGQAFNAGVTNTNQGYQGQQNTMNLLQSLLGGAQSASIGGPVQSTPGVGTQMSSTLAGLLPFLFQNQNQAQG